MEGSFTYTSSEGYDEFLGKRGVPWIVRKMILAAPVELQVGPHTMFIDVQCAVHPTHFTVSSFSVDKVSPGEQWTMAYKSPIKTNSYEFKLVIIPLKK